MDDFNAKERKHIDDWERDAGETAHASIARLTYSESMDEILTSAKDIVIPVMMPKKPFYFANEMLTDALSRLSVTDISPLLATSESDSEDDEILTFWRLNSILNWQMLDRQVDE
jgi:hypothetical protein